MARLIVVGYLALVALFTGVLLKVDTTLAFSFGVVLFLSPALGTLLRLGTRGVNLVGRASGMAGFGPHLKPMIESHAAIVLTDPRELNNRDDVGTVGRTVITRILGNDLPPRHRFGQSLDNLTFILDHEPEFPGVEKTWILNRIREPETEAQMISRIEEAGQSYTQIPFDSDAYAQIGWDFDHLPTEDFLTSPAYFALSPEQQDRLSTAIYRKKNLYLMNNNGARNAALRSGRECADWTIVLDGNCFLTAASWGLISRAMLANADIQLLVIPMARVTTNASVLGADFYPEAQEEPQLALRSDLEVFFNEDFPYGRRPKVELMWHLGIPGPWDRWKSDPWDQQARRLRRPAARYGVAGWVARLDSGKEALELPGRQAARMRGAERQKGIRAAIDDADSRLSSAGFSAAGFYSRETLSALKLADLDGADAQSTLKANVISFAEKAFRERPLSVKDKKGLSPSGDPADYWSVAPYWWPNSDTADGIPFVRRDGVRAPGTELFSPGSERYDRSNWQHTVDRTVSLILAWAISGESRFAEKAVENLRCWFITSDTRMNPSLKFAQVIPGRDGGRGQAYGIIEFKDLYYLLDAAKLLEGSGFLTDSDCVALEGWANDYLGWLLESDPGRQELAANNNQGTFFDLQVGGLQSYLGDFRGLQETVMRALSRLPRQIGPEGQQPHEEARRTPFHYGVFNLQGMLNLLLLAQRSGVNVGSFQSHPLDRLRPGIARCDALLGDHDPRNPERALDGRRLVVLRAFLSELSGPVGDTVNGWVPSSNWAPRPHDGVPFIWQGVLTRRFATSPEWSASFLSHDGRK